MHVMSLNDYKLFSVITLLHIGRLALAVRD